MSAAEATSAEITHEALHSSRVLDQEPEKGDKAAPRNDGEGARQQQAASRARLEAHEVAFLGAAAISQLAWMGALLYFAYQLLF